MVGARIVVSDSAVLKSLVERIKFNGGAIFPKDSHDKSSNTINCCGLNADSISDLRKHPNVVNVELFDDHEEQVYM